MSSVKFKSSSGAARIPDKPVELAKRLAEEPPEDIVDLLNYSKPGFVAAVLQALREAQAVQVLDQPQLAHGATIVSNLPSERAARLIEQISADRAANIVREMRVSVRNDLLASVGVETRAALDKLLPYLEDCAGRIMTTEFVAVPSDWTVERVLDHIRAVEHTRETAYAILSIRSTARWSRLRRCFLAIPRLKCYTRAVRKLSCSPKPCRSQGFSFGR
jgi:magnesium transporter